MKKKLIAVLVLALVVSTVSVFAFGIGIQGGWDKNLPKSGNVAITFKVDKSPLVFAASFNPPAGALGLTGDYWISNANIAGPLNYYFGVGFGASIFLGDDVAVVGAVRAPIGLNAFFADGLIEPYVQAVPQLILPIPSFKLDFDISVNAGIRFWF